MPLDKELAVEEIVLEHSLLFDSLAFWTSTTEQRGLDADDKRSTRTRPPDRVELIDTGSLGHGTGPSFG